MNTRALKTFSSIAFVAALAAAYIPAHAQTSTRAALVDHAMEHWKQGLDDIAACDATIGDSPEAFQDQAKWSEAAETCLSQGAPNLYKAGGRAAVAIAIRNTAEERLPRHSAAYWLEAGKARAELAIFEHALDAEVLAFGDWLKASTGSTRPQFYALDIPVEEMAALDKLWPVSWAAYSTHLRDNAIVACSFRDRLHDLDGNDTLPSFPSTGEDPDRSTWLLDCMQRHGLELQNSFGYRLANMPDEVFMFARLAK
jgi:hypothetical protein